MKFQFLPIDYNSFDLNGENYLQIYGRNEQNQRLCLIDQVPTYLWAILKNGTTTPKIKKLIEKIKKIKISSRDRETTIKNIELKNKNFLGKPVKALKIYSTNHKDLSEIANKLDFKEISKRRGYDLNYITHYINEKKLAPLNWYEIEGEILTQEDLGGISQEIGADFIIKLNSFIPLKKRDFSPKALAYDIETDGLEMGKSEILMVSLYGKNFQKVISSKKTKTNLKYVEFVENEEELIEKFIEHVKKYSPDFLIGYNSDNFDLPYLKSRAEKNKIKFNLGLDNSIPKISRGINVSGKINGITHIDLIKFIRTTYSQYMQSETLSLNEVSKEFLGEEKKDFKIKHSTKLNSKELEKYYEYNLQDSKLTLDLFNKFWPDLLEFSLIIQEPIFEISRNGLSKQIESYILHNLEKYNEIPERKPNNNEIIERRSRGGVQGAFVYEPKPGIYENLVMFDFTSMHTSIIISHNLSKASLEIKKKNQIKSPDIEMGGKKINYYFSKDPSFIPLVLREIFEKRKKYKQEDLKKSDRITKARSNAFKLLSASAHGYIGFFGARYYSWEASASILAFVRKYNQEIMEKIEKEGYKIIMGDTDSVAFTRKNSSKSEIKNLLEKLNDELPGVMHLELEDFFKRGIWVTTRSGETGAKKKYALINEDNKVKIRGFETVRRDWCKLARKTQDKIIRLILTEGNEKKALDYLKKVITQLKERKISLEELIIKTQLKKSLENYKSLSPHVIAAKKMREQNIPLSEGGLIQYYIAESKTPSKLVRDKVKLLDEKGEYNLEYYLDKQIIPAVENIFHIFGIEINEIIKGNKQDNLNKWF